MSASSSKPSRNVDAAEFSFEGAQYRYVAFELREAGGNEQLSPAEQEVAWRVVNGESHKAIARARGTSVHTVANQLASVFLKLGVNGRNELAHALRGRDRPLP